MTLCPSLCPLLPPPNNTLTQHFLHAPQVGAALGLAAFGYLVQDSKAAKPIHYLGSAGVGAATGVLAHMLTRSTEHKTPNKMIHELRN